ncbi:MAG TPA: DUF1343 domain-containing protein [Leptospiraceae bacterium]|nr:DUF1343 domain-containing protein [Leptospiraceae bacterium]HMW08522.1 DUF1343 domain-containing protein [Leptospiraceae bacterium]HMX31969.1 DUF1343 domain-containing protein [Leptospiraceae bacterium]HMY34354.1 DUF1343 domain-containing protein [Leptospiraceae bacterium]HMZ66940.1 DUF1343 domain-containing protein [Leptospiraceae bacterium]
MNLKKLKKFKNARVGILTNQSAFTNGKYHFEILRENLDLKVIFIPEHGLFAELQDQVSGSGLKYDFGNIKLENLYGDEESSLFVKSDTLKDLDLIVFDIRDVGARYYTFLTSCYYILDAVGKYNISAKDHSIEILVIDSPNPAGKNVEGSPLLKKYSSFVGVETVLHRHGLTIYELMEYYQNEFSISVKIHKIPIGEFYSKKDKPFLWVPPSPNIPAVTTCYVYSGQCLLEGTNLSEGRGTTRPFETFGAPYIQIQDQRLLKRLTEYQTESFILRPLLFIPTFHKHKGEICGGFQILLTQKKKFHSLLFSLHLLRTLREFYPNQFQFLKGVYEFRSDYSAIELLAGDDKLLDFLNGESSYLEIKDYLTVCEENWKKKF